MPRHTRGGRKNRQGISRSQRAGLCFPVGRIHRKLRKGNYSHRLGFDAPLYLTAVLECMTSEIVQVAGFAVRNNTPKRINAGHLLLAIQKHEELNKLLSGVANAQGVVLQNIQTSSAAAPAEGDT